MTKPVRLSESAEADLDAAIAWYNAQSDGLGLRFYAAIREVLLLLEQSPSLGSRVLHSRDPDARQLLARTFPFSVVYYDTESEVRVVAIAHAKRRPGYWQE